MLFKQDFPGRFSSSRAAVLYPKDIPFPVVKQRNITVTSLSRKKEGGGGSGLCVGLYIFSFSGYMSAH